MQKSLGRTLGLATSASIVALVISQPVMAQEVATAANPDVCANLPADAPVPPECQARVESADGSTDDGTIVVTGSRIRQPSTYTSISPIQVLSTEASRDVGEFDAAEILQRSPASAGQQIDATFQGFVLPNGPGSQTINLRGLGAERTLLLINGRRLAPAGVEGAPSSPSINLLPTSLIARYDLLLDGASSIYGSDAVAGVGNVVLRKDIDGPELFVSGNVNPAGGGDDYTISGAWGKKFDRGFFGIGAEYALRDEVKLRDRSFLAGCDRNYEIDQNGNILTVGLVERAVLQNQTAGAQSVQVNECKLSGFTNRIFQNYSFGGSAYYVGPGKGNYPGFPNFPYADSANALGAQLDRNNDGIRDVDFYDFNTNGTNPDRSFITQQKLYNVMAYGEYDFGGSLGLTPFFEALYSRAEVFSDNTGAPQFFPSVPDINPFNPCNISGTNPTGTDCRLIDNAQANGFPVYAPPGTAFSRGTYGISLPVDANALIRGDRNNTDVVQEQYRGVLGLKGDLPFLGDSWTFETSGVYSRSVGTSIRRGIREDRLALALGIDPTADFDGDGVIDNDGDGIADDYDNDVDIFGGPRVNIGDTRPGAPGANFVGLDPRYIGPCGKLSNPGLAAPDLVAGCVPVNLFAPSIFARPFGDFATPAERNYLFGERIVKTTYQQLVLSAFATGKLFELPAGPVNAVFGAEYRKDKINTTPNAVASNGLFFGFFRDLGTNGSKYIMEGFGELDIPLFDSDYWGSFDLNLAGRVTKEEFYGTAGTYSIKAGWQILPQILLRASYGTSFRAPNLRENFLGGITGFTSVTDPCAVPTAAFQAIAGNGRPAGYQADLDNRDKTVLDICKREGRDPTIVGINTAGSNTVQVPSIEVATVGSLALRPETSRSFTTGLAVSERYGAFNVNFNFNYYSIEVRDSIAGTTAQFAVDQCYQDKDSTRSVFCDQLKYEAGNRRLIFEALPLFLNQDLEKVKGLDFNMNIGYNQRMGPESLRLGLNLQANRLLERSTLFLVDPANPDFTNDTGDFGYPRWTGRATFSADYQNFGITWQTRFIGRTEQPDSAIDALSDAFGRGPDGRPAGVTGDTCLGNGSGTFNATTGVFTPNNIVKGDGVFCRDVGFAKKYFVHTASVRYNFTDDIQLRAGVSNVFDKAPPKVDSSEVLAIANTPIGNGYDLNGREFFGSISVKF